MSILLDSHTLVWFLTGSPRLPGPVRAAIEAPGARVLVSAVSPWEIATKVRGGRWPEAEPIARGLPAAMEENGLRGLPITLEHGRVAGSLSGAHRDPFDRMLAAQAIVDDLTLATADPAFRAFDVRTLW